MFLIIFPRFTFVFGHSNSEGSFFPLRAAFGTIIIVTHTSNQISIWKVFLNEAGDTGEEYFTSSESWLHVTPLSSEKECLWNPPPPLN